MPKPRPLFTVLSYHFSTKSKNQNLPKLSGLSKIHPKYKTKAIEEAQMALIDYLHSTSSLPFTYAEHIGKNSPFSLSNIIGKIKFSAPNFSRNIRRFLRYHPINEFEFFFESIGIEYHEVVRFLPMNKFFFSEDGSVLSAAYCLSAFGFPWNKLGILYKEEVSIFSRSKSELVSRLHILKDYGFSNVIVIGTCLAFPCLLDGEGELSGENERLLDDLKMIFVDFDLAGCIDENVDDCFEVCKKIRVFYDFCFEKGKVGELIGRGKGVLLEYPQEVLLQKVEYFCRLGVKKEGVGLLLIQIPEILNLDLETPSISVLELLKHFGLGTEKLNFVREMYPYVLGRNKMVNLPCVMKALDLHEWFFNKIRNGNHHLLANCSLNDPNEDLDEEFTDALEKIKVSRTPIHTIYKLKFLHGIGYGENALTIKVLAHLHGTSSELQERFDRLLGTGVEYSKLCLMIRTKPKILNQKPESLEEKTKFLCREMRNTLQYLDIFPAFLCFDLENRIKPRYRFHTWLMEKGLCSKNYSIASIVATSEKNFIARLYGIHPAAPKHWFESFYIRKA